MTTTWLKNDGAIDLLGGGLDYAVSEYLKSLAQSVARPGMIGFDIGCYTGWTAMSVAPIFAENGGHFFMADWYRGSPATHVGPYWWGDYDSPAVLLATLNNIEAAKLLDSVSLCVAKTTDLAKIVADETADYVYIGADHRYTPFKADVLAWLPKLRPGGVMCGHAFLREVEENSDEWREMDAVEEQDYYHSHNVHFGIVKAVHELLPGYVIGGGQIWTWRKPL